MVHFSVDASPKKGMTKPVAIGVRVQYEGKKEDRFICHGPAGSGYLPSLSAAGIYVPVECEDYARLSLTLLSPDELTVARAGICVTEI